MKSVDPFDLGQLAEYEIVGELSGREDAKVLLATRREDQRPVLVTMVREPADDAGNALSHLAADANLLAATPHPHVVRVLEGRWVGKDAFAMVTERPSSPSLEEMLTRRNEEFPYTRVAAVLRDVNVALEWARSQRIVHRALRLDTVYVEPGSDDVQVSFVMTALPATGTPGADGDARTVASLARAMLTRSVMDPERDAQPLAELRPGLPTRLIEQTEALLAATEEDDLPDVSSYIAAIAMAEELKQAETERENVRREIEEEQQRIRAELAAEREAHDRDLAEQAKKFAREREEEREAMAKQRAKDEKEIATEREQEREAMAKQRAKDEKEIAKLRAALEKERQQLARAREVFEREREDFERQSAALRATISRKLAALEAQASLYGPTSELPTFSREDVVPPMEAATLAGMTPLMDHGLDSPGEPYDEIVDDDEFGHDAPATDEPVLDEVGQIEEAEADEEPVLLAAAGATPEPSVRGQGRVTPWTERFGRSSRFRTAGVALLILIILVGAGALALSRRGDRARRMASRAPVGLVVDSVAGTVSAPVAPVDSTSLVPATMTPEQAAPPVAVEPRAPATRKTRVQEPTPPVTAGDTATGVTQPPITDPTTTSPVVARRDSMRPLPFTRPDSARSDSAMRTRPDSLPKVVLPKLDSLLPRRDTMPGRVSP